MWCVAELDEEYIARMEDVLAVYEKPLSAREPVVCIDEKPVVLHQEVRPPVAMRPGRVARRDGEYQRCGTANVFCGVQPKAGRHFAKVAAIFDPVNPFIVWNSSAAGEDSIDQLSFQNAFMSIGLLPARISLSELGKTDLHYDMLIIIPHASASLINEQNMNRIQHAVKDGACVITDGNSSLADLMKIKLSSPAGVKNVRDLTFPSVQLHWADAPKVPMILNAPDKSCRLLYIDPVTGRSLGMLKNSGKGMFLFLSALFDPVSGEGYSRFPDLPNLVVKEMHCT